MNALTPPVFRREGADLVQPARTHPRKRERRLVEPDDPGTSRFCEADELTRTLEEAGVLAGKDVIVYCGGGISATIARLRCR